MRRFSSYSGGLSYLSYTVLKGLGNAAPCRGFERDYVPFDSDARWRIPRRCRVARCGHYGCNINLAHLRRSDATDPSQSHALPDRFRYGVRHMFVHGQARVECDTQDLHALFWRNRPVAKHYVVRWPTIWLQRPHEVGEGCLPRSRTRDHGNRFPLVTYHPAICIR